MFKNINGMKYFPECLFILYRYITLSYSPYRLWYCNNSSKILNNPIQLLSMQQMMNNNKICTSSFTSYTGEVPTLETRDSNDTTTRTTTTLSKVTYTM